MSKPTNLALWATTGTKVEPSSGVKAAGWAANQRPPAQWWNWWMYSVYLWMVWLDAFESTAHTWSAAQNFASPVTFTVSGSDVIFVDGFHSEGTALFDLNVLIGTTLDVTGAVTLASTLGVTGLTTIVGLQVNGNSVFGGAGHTHQHVFQGDVQISGSLLAQILTDFAEPAKAVAIPLNSIQPLLEAKAWCTFTCNGGVAPTYDEGANIAGIAQAGANIQITFAQNMTNTLYQVDVTYSGGAANGGKQIFAVQFVKATNTYTFTLKNADATTLTIGDCSGGIFNVTVKARQ